MSKEEKKMYRKYRVQLQIRDKILGGIPKNPELIQGWLKSKGLEEKAIEEIAAKTEPAVAVAIEEETNKAWTGFKSDEDGVYIEGRQVKALLKEACSMLRIAVKKRGTKQVLQHGTFVKPEKIYLNVDDGDDSIAFEKPTDHLEMVAHVVGPRGPRSTIKRHDYVERPFINIEIWVVDNEMIPMQAIKDMLTLGQEIGLGCSRSQDFGKFDLVSFEEIKE